MARMQLDIPDVFGDELRLIATLEGITPLLMANPRGMEPSSSKSQAQRLVF